MADATAPIAPPPRASHGRRNIDYLLSSPTFLCGAGLLLLLVLFTGVGRFVMDADLAEPLSAMPNQPPSWETPFGTDSQGRNLLAVLILGTGLTLKVGLLAGMMGIVIGASIGLIAAYYGGLIDMVLRWAIDVGLTIPPLLLLIVIASSFQGQLSSTGMALIIGCLAWFGPARQVRAQALVLRRSGYVLTARLSGMGGLEIVFKEILPNLLPYLMAALVLATSAAILSSVGLEALGLGPKDEPTLGMTVYWMLYYTAFIRGLWWWIIAPIAMLIILFIGLYLVSQSLDELANPRLRQRTS